MLLHGHAVGQRERKRAAAAAFAHEHAHRGHAQPRHGIQVVGDRVALAAFLGLFAAKRALRVHEAHHRTPEALGLTHKAQTLAVALGLRAAEVALDAILQVAALFLRDKRRRLARDPADARHNGGIVGETAIAVALEEALTRRFQIAARGRSMYVARGLHAGPRGIFRRLGLLRSARLGGVLLDFRTISTTGRHRAHAVRDALRHRHGSLGGNGAHAGKNVALVSSKLRARRFKLAFRGIRGQRGENRGEPTRRARFGFGMQRKQVRERLTNARTFNDGVDKAMLKREFRRLEFLGKLLANGVLDHAAASEADERAGLGNNHVTLHRKTRGHATRGGVGNHREIRQARFAVTLNRGRNFRHLHERNQAFLHARAARASEQHQRQALFGGMLGQTRDALAHHRAHRAHEERGIHYANRNAHACDAAHAAAHALAQARLLSHAADFVQVAGEIERVGFGYVGAFGFKPALEAFRIEHARQALGRRHAEMMAALGAHFVIGEHALRVGNAVALRTRDPRVVAHVQRRVVWRRAGTPHARDAAERRVDRGYGHAVDAAMLVGRHGKETLVNRETRIDEQNRLRIGRFGRGKHAIAVVESARFAAFAHADGFRSELHMRRTRHVFGIGDARHKTRRQAAGDDGFARRARINHEHARSASRTYFDQAFQRFSGRVNSRRFLLARERVDALCGRSRGRSGRIANGHICRFLRTQHNCTLSLRTNLLHVQPAKCS